MPVDSNRPRRHVVRYIHDDSVSKTHLEKLKKIQDGPPGLIPDMIMNFHFRHEVQAACKLHSISLLAMKYETFALSLKRANMELNTDS